MTHAGLGSPLLGFPILLAHSDPWPPLFIPEEGNLRVSNMDRCMFCPSGSNGWGLFPGSHAGLIRFRIVMA